MAVKFGELKQYISRVARISITFRDGHYDNYSLISDIPDGKYDYLYIYGIGMIDVEFPWDVYAKPKREMPQCASLNDGYHFGCGLEIVVQEEPRDDIERHDDQKMRFGDLREYLQIGGNFSVVMKEDRSSEEYEWRDDIPHEYDELYVYGIGLEDNPKEIHNPRFKGMIDPYFTKQMVIVLSKAERDDILPEMKQMPDYEVKIVLKSDLNKDDLSFIKNKIDEISDQLGMYVHNDGVTYSKKEPYSKFSDIPAGTKFYFKLKKFEKYFALLEYYSYMERDINGRRL